MESFKIGKGEALIVTYFLVSENVRRFPLFLLLQWHLPSCVNRPELQSWSVTEFRFCNRSALLSRDYLCIRFVWSWIGLLDPTSEQFIPITPSAGWGSVHPTEARCSLREGIYFELINPLVLLSFRFKCQHHPLPACLISSPFVWRNWTERES